MQVLNRKQNGCFLDSCLVHEQNIDACCGQPQPSHLNQIRSGCCTNCAGWSLFSLPDGASLASATGESESESTGSVASVAAASSGGGGGGGGRRRTAQQAFGDWFNGRPSASTYLSAPLLHSFSVSKAVAQSRGPVRPPCVDWPGRGLAPMSC